MRKAIEDSTQTTSQPLRSDVAASQERYLAFIQQSTEGIWRFELRQPVSIHLQPEEQIKLWFEYGYLAECNLAVAKMYGADVPEDLIGKPIPNFLNPSDPANMAYLLQFIGSNYRLSHAESHEVDVHEKSKYFSNSLVGILEDDHLVRVWGTKLDITDRKQLEQEKQELLAQLEHDRERLAHKEEQYLLALDAGKVGMWDWDILTNRVAWSDRVYEMHNLRKDQFNGTFSDFQELIVDEDKKNVLQPLASAIHGDKAFQVEFRIKLPGGKTRWVGTSGIVISDDHGTPIRMVGASVDQTEQRELDRRKDEFLGIASHELKTPLTSIKGYTQIAQRLLQQGKEDTASEYLQKINIYIDRLNSLIADLLDVSRLQAGKLQFNTREFEFDQLIKETVKCIQPTTDHLIKLHGKTGEVIRGDPDRVEQVMTNLLTNAIKYSPEGKQVDVTLSVTKNEVAVHVKDYGIGIAAEHLSMIFDRFYRVESISHRFSGLGIGLYISAEIIKRHGGKIHVYSETGKGSTFEFMLPLLVKN